jgi:hypothetical protein
VKLIRYEAARAALAAAHRVDEVKDIRDKAEAMAAYARQARDTQMIEWATEIKVRAERRCGELLRDAAESGQRATVGENQHTARSSHDASTSATLRDLGLTYDQSSRYQKLAAMPEEQFEVAVETAKAQTGEVTTAFMLRKAAELTNLGQQLAAVTEAARSRSIHPAAATESTWLSIAINVGDLVRLADSFDCLSQPPRFMAVDKLRVDLPKARDFLISLMETLKCQPK